MSKTNVLLLGPAGAGKTSAIRTLARVKKVRVLSTDMPRPESLELLRDIPPERLAWHYQPPATVEFTTLIDNARVINSTTNEQLQKRDMGLNKSRYGQFIMMLEAFANFTDDRTGAKLGPVDSWDDECALVLDHLTGLNQMSLDLVVGAKPVKTQPDWGVAMDNEERLIDKLVSLRCSFVLISHIDRERDEITGGTSVTAAALGRKLGPRIPIKFDEAVLADKKGQKFVWSTTRIGYDLKNRVLPLSDDLEPDFAQCFAPVLQLSATRANANA